MDLQRHIDRLREQLALAAEPAGEEARSLARQLILAMDAAVRLTLLEALSEAAAEVTRELAPRAVELRLRGGEPELVVTAAAEEPRSDLNAEPEAFQATGARVPLGGGEGGTARINLRLPDHLKTRVEQAADREGLSINAWLVRAAAAAVVRGALAGAREPATPRGGGRFTGWGR